MCVSVVVPTRNRSALLSMTLRSVLGQRDVRLEVVVVDEASTDDTPAVLEAFGDARIRVLRHDAPRGVSTARNHGAAEARGDWIAFLDDDDLWAPDKLAEQLRAARASGAPWVYVGHVNINMQHEVTGGAPPVAPDLLLEQLPQRNVVPGGCSGVMVSKEALARAGGFDPRLQPLADWDLWLRLVETGAPAWVPRPLVAYRVHGNQMSLDAHRVEAEFRMLRERHGQADAAVLYRYLGWWALRVKNHREALRLFMRAALARQPGYGVRALAGDLACLGGDMLEHRLGIPVPRRNRSRHLPAEARIWRLEGQAWVDALVGQSAGGGGD